MTRKNKHNSPAATRIWLLDEIRGVLIVLMVAFHAFYTGGTLFGIDAASRLFRFFSPAEPFFAGCFILLCGMSCRLSHNNLLRGLKLAAVAALLSLVMYVFMPDQMIWFGILHLLSVCLLLYAALHRVLDKIPAVLGIIICAALFLLTWHFPQYQGGYIGIEPFAVHWPEDWQALWWTMPLGIGNVESADYFPIIPWFFCFLGGAFLGHWLPKLPKWCAKPHIRPLAFLGRHSLIIYLLHQPVIYAICTLITRLLPQIVNFPV